jgi:hypothetical protein
VPAPLVSVNVRSTATAGVPPIDASRSRSVEATDPEEIPFGKAVPA